MKNEKHVLVFVVLAAAFFGALLAIFAVSLFPAGNDKIIHDFYLSQSLVSISPTDYLNDLKDGKQIWAMVDLRNAMDYNTGHIVGAINIPVEGMSDAKMLSAFRAIPSNRTIITYCYAEHCTLSRKVGLVLANNGIYAKHLTTGALENARDFAAYIVTGSQPGVYVPGPNGQFTCSATGGNFTC